MYLIVVLLAIVVMQFSGSHNPLHRDGLFLQWIGFVSRLKWLSKHDALVLTVTLVVPIAIILAIALHLPTFFWFCLSLIILLYSLGRGEFAPEVQAYTLACSDNAWPEAVHQARKQGVDPDCIATHDWAQLNKKMLEATAYQGFERLFAVLFWFILFGPAGALLYRLSFLYLQNNPNTAAARWLWAMEWPAVRILGVSFAVTGNFVGCINRWQAQALSIDSASTTVLRETVLGSLSIDDELVQSCDSSQREVAAIKRLYARTLWFWVACLALWTLLY